MYSKKNLEQEEKIERGKQNTNVDNSNTSNFFITMCCLYKNN